MNIFNCLSFIIIILFLTILQTNSLSFILFFQISRIKMRLFLIFLRLLQLKNSWILFYLNRSILFFVVQSLRSQSLKLFHLNHLLTFIFDLKDFSLIFQVLQLFFQLINLHLKLFSSIYYYFYFPLKWLLAYQTSLSNLKMIISF